MSTARGEATGMWSRWPGILPPAIIFMIVGPHSGFSLAEIVDMKRMEEAKLGCFFWGYAGSLCHPSRVQAFATAMLARHGQAPVVLMGETASKYRSKTIGRITGFSDDGLIYEQIREGVTLIGCTFALTCRALRRVQASIDLNAYTVANGTKSGMPLGRYLRFQLNKACAVMPSSRDGIEPRVVNVTAAAELVPPYCVYLAE